jgi:hypothetical protein
MLREDIPTFGPHMAVPGGVILQAGKGEFLHRFGGDSWAAIDPNSVHGGPTLLITLDLSDPLLSELWVPGVNELPLASYINCSVWDGRQVFQWDPVSREVCLICREITSHGIDPLADEDRLPDPLPDVSLRSKGMSRADWPLNEDSYWRNYDRFIGSSSSFLRVLGPPLWLQWVQEEECSGGHPMKYTASIGYEEADTTKGIVGGRPFFIGEGALYFFVCLQCKEIVVVSQSS